MRFTEFCFHTWKKLSQSLKRLVFSALGALLATSLLAWLNTASLSLSPERHDHISQLSTAAVMRCEGLRMLWEAPEKIFPRALKTLDGNGELVGDSFANLSPEQKIESDEWTKHYRLPQSELFIANQCTQRVLPFVWAFYPRPYGPGFFALIWPIAELWSQKYIDTRTALLSVLYVMLFFSFISIFLVKDILLESRSKNHWVKYVILYIVVSDSLRWALNGQFDSVSFFFMLLALRSFKQEKWNLSLLSMSASFFFQFRTLFWAPLALFCIYKGFQEKKWFRNFYLYFSALLGGTSLFVLLKSYEKVQSVLKTVVSNPIYIYGSINYKTLATYTLLLLILLWISIRQKAFLVALNLLWLTAMILTMPYFKSMHALYLTPLMLLPAIFTKLSSLKYTESAFALFYIFIAGSLFVSNPFDFNLMKELYMAF